MNKKLSPVSKTLQLILRSQKALPKEKVSLLAACQRVLAQDIKAASDRPAFDRSAMDGYAISAKQAGPYRIQGETPAGNKTHSRLKAGHCLRIYTGSALPGNCLAVLPQELVQCVNQFIQVKQWPKNTFIRRRGEDARHGDILLKQGTPLLAPEIAILAQEGAVHPMVHSRVRVAHLAMGKELVDPASTPSPHKIRDSNSSLIAALLQNPSCELTDQRRMGDTPAAAQLFFKSRSVRKAHVLLISGGAGSGDHDWGRYLIKQLGFHILVRGVDLRPGKPLIVARRGPQTLFVLPGNPVSHWVTWQLFIQPLLKRLGGLDAGPVSVSASLEKAWKHSSDSRTVWWPGKFVYRNGQALVSPLALQSSGDAGGLCGANCLIHFPRSKEDFQPGHEVAIMPCHSL